MKNSTPNLATSHPPSRSVLDCGGAPPLSSGAVTTSTPQSAAAAAQSKSWRSLVATLLFLGGTTGTFAQTYSIPWSKIAGGGGTSTGGVYAVTGTIGQHDAGTTMTNGAYALTGGFWSLVQVVQTPGAPHLSMTLTTTNTAVVAWPTASSTGFILQQATDLTTADWTSAPAPQDDGTNKRLIVAPPAGTRFYRLFKP
jgi:hypothetical protein